jgi:hypothetical protein
MMHVEAQPNKMAGLRLIRHSNKLLARNAALSSTPASWLLGFS